MRGWGGGGEGEGGLGESSKETLKNTGGSEGKTYMEK